MGMTFTHVLPTIVMWTAKCHCQKGFLFSCLFVHINIIKKTIDTVIVQNFTIKNIHCCIDCRFPADSFVKCFICDCLCVSHDGFLSY